MLFSGLGGATVVWYEHNAYFHTYSITTIILLSLITRYQDMIFLLRPLHFLSFLHIVVNKYHNITDTMTVMHQNEKK